MTILPFENHMKIGNQILLTAFLSPLISHHIVVIQRLKFVQKFVIVVLGGPSFLQHKVLIFIEKLDYIPHYRLKKNQCEKQAW